MHPPKGYVFQTGRQRRSTTHLIWWAFWGWIGIFWLLLYLVLPLIFGNPNAEVPTEVVTSTTSSATPPTENSNQMIPKPSLSTREQVF